MPFPATGGRIFPTKLGPDVGVPGGGREAGRGGQGSSGISHFGPFPGAIAPFHALDSPITPWPWPLQGFLLPTRVRREFGFEGHEPPPFLFQPFSLYPLKPTSMLDCPRRGRTRGRVFRAGRIPRSAWVASPRRQSSPSSTIRCLRIMLKHVCCSRSVDLSRAHADGRAHTCTRSRTRSHTERSTRLSAGCLRRFRFKGSILSLRSGPEHRSVMASFRSHHC